MALVSLKPMLALTIFAGAYVGLGLGRLPPFRVDRTGVAIVGATAMVVAGVLDWNAAVAAVDARTLALLFGMMIVAAYLRLSGFFGLVTTWAMRRASTPVGALAAVVVAAGTLSALFVNDVICVVMAPLVVDLTRRLGLPPVPYLIALATAANVGSVATLTGNPQNMLIGSFSAISYRAFLLREAPVALVGLGCVFVVVWLVYRRQLPPALGAAAVEPPVTVHYPLMIKTVVAVLVMLAAFLGGVPIAIVAIAGAAATLLTRPGQSEQGLSRDRLEAARAVHRALRAHRRRRAHWPRRRHHHVAAGRRPRAPGGTDRGDRGALQSGVERAGGAGVQADRSAARRADAGVAAGGDGVHAVGKLDDPRLGGQPHRRRSGPELGRSHRIRRVLPGGRAADARHAAPGRAHPRRRSVASFRSRTFGGFNSSGI